MFLENLPDNPGVLIQQWLDDARTSSGERNWNVMMLATVGRDHQPSVRAVLLKDHDPDACAFTFFTNYRSRKARDMDGNPLVAATMYWDALDRQIRVEGTVEKVPSEISDAYFASRPRESQIGAWASAQSEPVEHYSDLVTRAEQLNEQYAGRPVPRPPHWGGYCITAQQIELWHAGPGRIHERIRYVRSADAPDRWTHRWISP